MNIYDQPLLVIRNGKIGTEAYWNITIPGTVVLVSNKRYMFLSNDNTKDGFWLVLGEQTQLTVQEFYDKFEMEPVVVVIDTSIPERKSHS